MKTYLASYIKEHSPAILLWIGCGMIWIIIFMLFRLPLTVYLYATALCLFGLGIWAVIDFRRYRSKMILLEQCRRAGEMMEEVLPSAQSLLEEQYQEMIHVLCAQSKLQQQDAKSRFEEMMDYYTLWVHQIKTPIASMGLTLQNEDTSLSRKISADLFRIEQYVEMVMTYLRLDGEQTDYVFRDQDVDRLIREALKKYSGEFTARRLSLSYEPVHLQIITDEKWMSFVLEQVLSNALKYTASGTISIYREGDSILCIQDTGCGMEAEDLPRIFQRGYTGTTGRHDKRATGIGLYLCKRICQGLGHGISAESKPEHGTIMRIDFSQHRFSGD